MRTLERLLVKFTMSLCNLFDVTPQHLEELRQKKQRPPRPEERYDYFGAWSPFPARLTASARPQLSPAALH